MPARQPAGNAFRIESGESFQNISTGNTGSGKLGYRVHTSNLHTFINTTHFCWALHKFKAITASDR